MRFPLLLAAGALLALAGCDPAQPSTAVDQDRIHTRYELREDAEGRTARAYFRFGGPTGTQLVLDGGATVAYAGERLTLNQTALNLTYYEAEVSADAGLLTYTDADGQRFENRLAFPAPIDVEDGLEFSNDADLVVPFSGPPVAAGEVVKVIVVKGGSLTDTASGEQRTAGARSVTVRLDAFDSPAPGELSLSISRTRTGTPAETPGVGGEVLETYESPTRTAFLID